MNMTHLRLTCHVVVVIILFGTIALGQQQRQQQQPRCRGCRQRAATKQDQINYFTKFAYMGSESPDSRLAAMTNPDDKFRRAVILFQQMAGLNMTGEVDAATMAMMEKPRCGVPDQVGKASVTKRRRRRYARQGGKWSKTSLTYRFVNLTTDLLPDLVKAEIKNALKMWSDVTPLTFTEETSSRTVADIDIRFVTYEHGDGNGFDGEGGTLAHAFFPPSDKTRTVGALAGDAHFDVDEKWTSRDSEGTNLLEVATHELGHSLGLEHSDVKTAVMAPFYTGYKPNLKLGDDDIRGIQAIYGRKSSVLQTTTKTPPLRSTTASRCSETKIDAIFAIERIIYAFQGNKVTQLHYVGDNSATQYRINSLFPGYPQIDSIDAATYIEPNTVYWLENFGYGRVYLFKRNKCWRYMHYPKTNTFELERGFPKYISLEFDRLPSDINAAFIWSGNDKLYFIKGQEYYKFSMTRRRMEYDYPRPLFVWSGLPGRIDAAFKYTNSRYTGPKTYFFSGNDVYRYNDALFQVDVGYPLKTSWFLGGCQRQSAPAPIGADMDEKRASRSSDREPVQLTMIVIFAQLTFSMLRCG